MVEKMKIFLVYDQLFDMEGHEITIGGIQSYIQELCLLIQSLGYTPIVLQKSKKNFTRRTFGTDVKGINKKVGTVPNNRTFYNMVDNEVSPSDLVIWMSDQYSKKSRTYKTISIQHGIGFDTEATHSKSRQLLISLGFINLYKFLQRWRAIRLFENSDNCVCVDYNFLNWYRTMRRCNNSRNIKVIPNFSRYVDKKVRTEENIVRIVYARRFVDRRGIDIALETAQKIVDKYENVEFYFAGSGPRYNEVIELTNLCDRIYYTSYEYSESIEFHSHFDIAIVPSIGSEGTSLSLLEAMGSGCTVVATNVGGMTNIIIDGFNGLLIEPTADSLNKAISDLVENKQIRTALSVNALDTIRYSFSNEKWKEAWKEYLIEVINR